MLNATNSVNKIGLFGGSFDPIHNGHIILAKKSLKQLELDYIFFIPIYLPPHKSRKLSNISKRLEMLKIAIKGIKKAKISYFEIKRKAKTYTYQIIEHFKKEYNKTEIYLIIGSDSALDLKKWKKYKKIINLSKVVFCERENYYFKEKKGFIKLIGTIPNISSTEIRDKIKKNIPIKNLVPINVEKYINKNGLYK